MNRRPAILFVVSAPSGTGKTTLVNRLVREVPGLIRSISHTTRAPRPGEIHGTDYFFVMEPEFREMVRGDRFLECKEVHGNWYGTSLDNVRKAEEEGADLVLVIDVEGAKEVVKRSDRVTTVFIFPPSLNELQRRMRTRKTESESEMNNRITVARQEIAASVEYDYHVVNDNLDTAFHELRAIVFAERCRNWRDGTGFTVGFEPHSGQKADSGGER